MEKVEGNLWRRRDRDGEFRYLYRRLLPVTRGGKKAYRDIKRALGGDIDKAMAETRRLDDYFEALLDGKKPKGAALMGEFLDWYVSYQKDERKLLGWQTPIGHLKRFVTRIGSDSRMDAVTRADVESFLHDLKGRISPTTIGGYHRSIRRMFNVAIQRGFLEKNPATGIRVDKPRLPEPRLPSVEDVRLLLDYLKTHRPLVYPIVVTLVHTGARLGEVLTLDWSRVDFIEGTLTLVRRKVNDTHRLAMAKSLNEMLYALWMTAGMPKEGLVFLGRLDQIRNRNCLFRSFKKVVRKLGMPYLNLKTFRKLAATWAAQGTHDVRAAQMLLGHQNLRTTEGYLGAGSESRDLAVKAIEDRLAGDGKVGVVPRSGG